MKSQGASVVSRDQWTSNEIDYALNTALSCDDENQFTVVYSNISTELGKGKFVNQRGKRSPQPTYMLLWKLATRYPGHTEYKPGLRHDRNGLLFSKMEIQMAKWAFEPGRDAQRREKKPDDKWLALLLGRLPYEASSLIEVVKAEHLGFKTNGFGLV